MLIVVSPAKTLDYESPLAIEKYTQPELTQYSKELIEVCRQLTPADISSLMKVSDKIAALNVARFEQWSETFTPDNARQAILAFKGDVYTGLDAETLSEQDFDYAQTHHGQRLEHPLQQTAHHKKTHHNHHTLPNLT